MNRSGRGPEGRKLLIKEGTIVDATIIAAKDMTLQLEKAKAQARAQVGHPFHIIKNLFKYRKVRAGA